MIDVVLYQRKDGRSPFADWFDALDGQAAAKVTIAIERLRLGNFSNVKGVGAGVQEFRIDWGSGYRLSGPRRRQARDPALRRDIATPGR